MKRFLNLSHLLAAIALTVLAQPAPLHACAVCYGEPDSPMTKGLTYAIAALATVVFAVLAAVVAFFVQSSRRTAAGDHTPPGAARGEP